MFSGLTAWYSVASWCACSWRRWFLPLLALLAAYSCLCRVGTSLVFLVHLGVSIGAVLALVMFVQSCWCERVSGSSDITRTQSYSKLPGPLKSFHPPLLGVAAHIFKPSTQKTEVCSLAYIASSRTDRTTWGDRVLKKSKQVNKNKK